MEGHFSGAMGSVLQSLAWGRADHGDRGWGWESPRTEKGLSLSLELRPEGISMSLRVLSKMGSSSSHNQDLAQVAWSMPSDQVCVGGCRVQER